MGYDYIERFLQSGFQTYLEVSLDESDDKLSPFLFCLLDELLSWRFEECFDWADELPLLTTT